MPLTLRSALGVALLFFVAWCLSERRSAFNMKVVGSAIILQFALALSLTHFQWSERFLLSVNSLVLGLDEATRVGTSFVFGYLGGDTLPFASLENSSSFILAFRALPLIIVLSALTALLNYWRILPVIIAALAALLRKSLPMNGATAFACVANIFVGMIESPLFIKAYLEDLGRAELFILMTVGMSTIAGTVLVIYVGFLQPVLPGAAGHLLVASLISVPAAAAIAMTMVPGDMEQPNNLPTVEFANLYDSAVDAIVVGTQQGLQLCLQIAALLIVFVSFIALLNLALDGVLPDIGGNAPTLQRLVGFVMAPIAWVIGIPWPEAGQAGQLLGIKIILNEFLAYHALGTLPDGSLSPRSTLIMSYALCGFANIGSLGILIGGLTTLAPSRRLEIIQLAPKAIISGTLATLMTGAVIGTLK